MKLMFTWILLFTAKLGHTQNKMLPVEFEGLVNQKNAKLSGCPDYSKKLSSTITELNMKFEKHLSNGELSPNVYDEYSRADLGVGEVLINSCRVIEDGEPLDEKSKPEKLFAATVNGVYPLTFQNIKRTVYHVCDSKMPQDLWVLRGDKKIHDGMRLIVNTEHVKVTAVSSSEVTKYEFVEADYEEMDRLNLKFSPYSDSIVTSKDTYRGCRIRKRQDVTLVVCKDTAYILIGNRIMMSGGTDGYGEPGIELLAKIEIRGRVYYYVEAEGKGSSYKVLVPEFGHLLNPVNCSLPTMC